MGWPTDPVVHEVNTVVWLDGRTLDDVPDEDWDALARPGVDAVWLMGVWERSAVGLALVPDLPDGEVIGSPYCVRRYVVDNEFGGPKALAVAREALARRGLRLVLDYVPNHVAPDHPWVTDHPEYFVEGTSASTSLAVGGRLLARGRDPYFPPWPDVVQLDAFSPALRAATVATLSDIAEQCDGIRCDMAMLTTNDVFSRTWDRPPPAEEFWPAVLSGLRAEHPEAVLIAEAYWDLEWTLRQQGFDFCYDKRLYDRLVAADPQAVRAHLTAEHQSHLLRFLENHDEPRVASRLPAPAARAATVALATLPGGTLWHEGQFEGKRTHVPVFLRHAPDEPADPDLSSWHTALLAAAATVREGTWQLLDPSGWPDNDTHRNLLAWSWTGDTRHLVVVNLSPTPSQARVPLPWSDPGGHLMTDVLRGSSFRRDGDELAAEGLFVSLAPWAYHVLAVSPDD